MKPIAITEEQLIKAHRAMQTLIKSTELKFLKSQKDISTEEAFNILLTKEGAWEKTGLPLVRRNYFRNLLKKGKYLTLDKKYELLKKAGFQETITWTFIK